MIHIAIVEDEERAGACLEQYLNRYAQEADESFQINLFHDALAFLDGYTEAYQLVFMDIEMPGLSGMEAAKRLRERDDCVQIIFVTNMAQYAVNGYEVRAMDFIVKPVEYSSFYMKMKRVMRYIHGNAAKQISVKKDKTLLRFELRKLYYVEVRGHNLEYHTENGVIEVRGKLSELEEKLKGEHFARCNNCYLVNLACVKAVRGLFITVGEDELRMSRSKRNAFLGSLTDYLGGGVLR